MDVLKYTSMSYNTYIHIYTYKYTFFTVKKMKKVKKVKNNKKTRLTKREFLLQFLI